MIRDPFYRAIVQRLGGGLDPDLFERCAADLLRPELPTLVPIRGGADAGMGEAYPLISTTGKDVMGNLSRNLNFYVSNGGERRRVVLATSQDLSTRRRGNLNKRASKKGFELVQIYDRAAFADRLYRDSRWCKELLLPGRAKKTR